MIKSYLRIALRSFQRNKLISFINIFGLGLSMSVGMMIMIRVQDQLGFDKFHPHPDRTYRILSEYKKKTGEDWKMASSPVPLEAKLRTGFDNIAYSVNIFPAYNGKATSSGKELYLNGAYTDPSFFNVFGFSLEAGDPRTALALPNTVVITKSTAQKYFGQQNPLGQVLVMENGKSFLVTGVLKEGKAKSHLNYDVYASFESISQLPTTDPVKKKSEDAYGFNTSYTYVVLKEGAARNSFQKSLNTVAQDLNKQNADGKVSFTTQSILEITPGKDYLHNDTANSSWTKFYFEMGIALIILVAACFNYTNLTIARSLTRAKEVGIRKITGARRSQIFIQYIVESVTMAFFALAFAWFLLSLIISYAPFNDDYEFIPAGFEYNLTLLLCSAGFAIVTGLLGGTAPAWILSGFKPLRVLKNLNSAKIFGKVNLQKSLIVFQYSLSLTILIFLLAFYKQFAFMAKSDPGFQKEGVLIAPLNGTDDRIAAQTIATIPGVKSSGAMSSLFKRRFSGMSSPAWISDKDQAIPLNYYYANHGFIDNMKLKFRAGHNFSLQSDEQLTESMIVNEQAINALGIKDAEKAVGTIVWLSDSLKCEIIGVVQNFTYENVGRPINPLAFRSRHGAYNYLYVQTENFDRAELTGKIDKALKTLNPSQSEKASWLDQDLAENNSQSATISLLGYLAFMTIAIATLGLLGLVIYTVEVKRKEISVRKVIGAGKAQLLKMLSYSFLKLIVIAGCIAAPLGYLAGFLFLQNFSNRVDFGIFSAVLCFSFLFLIGILTVVSQTYRAASRNPATDLRLE